jgi:hypothetical protein
MIVSGFKPRPFLYRMDLNYNESRKGSLRVHSLAVFVTDLLTMIVSGVLAPLHYLMMDLKSAKPAREVSGTLLQAMIKGGLKSWCIGRQKCVVIMV